MESRKEFQQRRAEAIKNDPELQEAERQRLLQWRLDHAEQERARSRKRYAENKEYYKRIRAEWWAKHPEKVKEYAAKKRAQNPEREKARVKRWYDNNKEYFVERNKDRREGPDREKYLKLLRYAQHKHYLSRERFDEIYPRLLTGPCEICGVMERMMIDHCHEKNVFRGVLCDKCNRGIGFLQDDPSIIRKAAEYLERNI